MGRRPGRDGPAGSNPEIAADPEAAPDRGGPPPDLAVGHREPTCQSHHAPGESVGPWTGAARRPPPRSAGRAPRADLPVAPRARRVRWPVDRRRPAGEGRSNDPPETAREGVTWRRRSAGNSAARRRLQCRVPGDLAEVEPSG